MRSMWKEAVIAGFEVLSLLLPGMTEENHKLYEYSRWPGRV
jgi:hypothetical protein